MAERSLAIKVLAEGAAKAAGLIGQVDKSVQKLGSRTGTIGKVSGALGHASKQVGSLVSSIGPLIGVTGVVGLGAAFGSSLTKASEFGVTISKLQGVLDLDAETTSALSDTLDKFDIAGDAQVTVLGRMEKNVAALASTQDKAAKFQKDYGFNLLGTNGQIADANTLLLRAADYYKSNASATDKATVLNKLYGKTWADMIPVLDLGSKGIKEEEKNAIHLTSTQLANMDKFKRAQRDFGDVVGDLQVKVGAELMPMITSALGEASNWLDTHSDDVVQFFKGAADFGAQLAEGARTAFGAIKAGWDLIPGPLKTLLIEGLVAGKVTKFLFDFGPMDFAKLATGLIKGVLGINAGVVNVNAAVVNEGGLPSQIPKAAAGLSLLTVAESTALLSIPVLLAAGAYGAFDSPEALAKERARIKAGGLTNYGGKAGGAFGGTSPTGGLPVGPVGDYGAPHPGSANAGSSNRDQWSVLGSGADARKNQAMQAILQRALNKGFRPSQAAVTATYERNVDRSTALTARRTHDVETAVKNVAPAVVAGIVGAIRSIGQPIVNVNVTASDISKVVTTRRRAVVNRNPRTALNHGAFE